MSNELPQAWATTTLGDLFDFKYGKGLPHEKRNAKGSIKVFGSNGVVGTHNSALTKGPTIIVGRKGSVGEVHLSPDGCWPIDTTYFIDEFPEKLPPTYWALYLKSLRLGQQEKSSAIPGISRSDVYDVEVAIPPVAEQQRIVAKLEKLLSQVDACQNRLAKIPVLLKRFRQSVLAAACSGRLTADWREEHSSEDGANFLARIRAKRAARFQDTSVRDDLDLPEVPESWSWTNLRFLLLPEEAFCYGVVQPGENDQKGAFLVRAGDLANGRIETRALRRIPRKVHEAYRRSQLAGGEVLVTVVGAGIGETAIAQPECAGYNIARAVAKLPVREFDARYVRFWLSTSRAVGWMKGDSREVARPTLNLEQLQTLPVPVPALSEQQEIVRRVESLFALADRIEARFAEGRKRVDSITQAILAKAFRGDLVPTEAELAKAEGRTFESAEQLLDRIKGS
jgi:type I restriction enzyme S subunit